MRKVNAAIFPFALAICASPASAQFIPGPEFDNQPALMTINMIPAYNAGLSGAGVKLGVVDSGVNPNHVEFSGAIVAGYDAITGLSGTSNFSDFLVDYVNHGSFIASVAAARLDGDDRPNNIQGVAFNADLVIGSMNFFDDAATTDQYAAAALDFVSSQSARVINSSWAWGYGLLDPSAEYQDFLENLPLTNAAIKNALDRGSVLVFTTGNFGGKDPLSTGILPSYDAEIAAQGGFITVTATSIDGTSLVDYANRCGLSKEYCIAAPGGDGEDDGPASTQYVLGADGGDSASNDGYAYNAGTSVSAPLVSGAVAIVAEQFPWMSNKNLATTILTTGSQALAPDIEWGRGLLDVGKAIQGPALFETDFNANVLGGYSSVFSNDIGYRDGLDGGLTKLGDGTLTLAGNNTYVGSTQVDSGTLVVNGSLISPVMVASGATLRGIGSLSDTLTIHGTLAPGDSLGTLSVNNTVTMNSGSWYQVNIDGTVPGYGDGSYSRLLVIGDDSQFIANGTLQPVLHDMAMAKTHSSTPRLGDTFRVVSADGGVVGRFSTLSQPNDLTSGTRFAAFYDVFSNQSIDLKLVPSSYTAYLNERNSNTRSLAGVLDQLMDIDQAGEARAAQTQLLYVTASKSAPELPGFVQSLSGEIHAALAAAVPQASQWLEGSVDRRLSVRPPSAQVITETSQDATAASALWLDIGRSHSQRKTDRNASGFTSGRSQLALGTDLLATDSARLGIGFSHADTDISADIGSASLTETFGFVYAQQSLSSFLLDGMVSYGRGNADSVRPDPTGLTRQLESTMATKNTLFNVRLRKPEVMVNRYVEPFASVTWQKAQRGTFDEGDAVASLGSSGHSDTGMRTLIGVAGSSLVQDPLSIATSYRLNLGVGYDAGDLFRPDVSARIAGNRTKIVAPTVGRTFMQANAFSTVRFDQRAYGYLGLNTELRKGLVDVGINIGAVVVF